MEEMSREEFERLKNTATQKMREIQNKKAPSTPFPDFVRVPNRKEETKEEDLPKGNFQKPIAASSPQKRYPSRLGGFLKNINLTEMLKDKDSLLILGLIFLLSNEEADESLIMALAYVLL